MKAVYILIILLLFFSIFSVFGETLPVYEPYKEEEFPKWALDLRRAEVIFFGTIPFTFFASSLSYDLYIYTSNSFNSKFTPALFGNTTPPILTNNEKVQIIMVSVSFSAFLAVLDYLLGEPWND